MGIYINPKNQVKKLWLVYNSNLGANTLGELVGIVPKDKVLYSDIFPVCWVDNGKFTAAAVGYNQKEAERFDIPDGREKVWLLVNKEALANVLDEDEMKVLNKA